VQKLFLERSDPPCQRARFSPGSSPRPLPPPQKMSASSRLVALRAGRGFSFLFLVAFNGPASAFFSGAPFSRGVDVEVVFQPDGPNNLPRHCSGPNEQLLREISRGHYFHLRGGRECRRSRFDHRLAECKRRIQVWGFDWDV
jgi:hypothetical protein